MARKKRKVPRLIVSKNAFSRFLEKNYGYTDVHQFTGTGKFSSRLNSVFLAKDAEGNDMMKEVETGLIDDGTAIGNGLATAIARMKDSDAKSRVVILLTDGVNNSGEMSPQMAVEIAKTYGVRVYTIGVGKEGMAPYPVMTPWGVEVRNLEVEIDEQLLKDIADATGGRYFRANDNTKLAEIYDEINQMEKARTTVDSFPVYKELFGTYALLALLALLVELIFNWFVIRRLI